MQTSDEVLLLGQSVCHIVDVSRPPKTHVLKSWAPVCGTIGRWEDLEAVGLSERALSHCRQVLKEDCGALVSSLPSVFLPGHNEVSRLHRRVLPAT